MTTGTVDKLFARYVRSGDPAALAEVFDRTAAEILRVARHFARDEAEAEDLLQDVFLRAIERAETFRVGERVVPWLLGVLVNAARARFRRRREGEAPEAEPAVVDDPAERAHDREVDARIRAALGGIPQPYRDVLERHLEHGQSGAQISHALGRSPNTVRSQLRRGLALLRAALPAGFAVACQPAPTRGLAAIREVVISRAEAAPAVAAVTSNASWIGVWLMSKKSVLVGAAAALLAGVWWITDPLAGDGVREESDVAAASVASSTAGEVGDITALGGGGERSAVTASEESSDARYERALAGFTGRVVDHEQDAIPGAIVELYRVDPTGLFGGDENPPELLVASTETDSEGHFTISRVPTRAMFVLRAAFGQRDRLRLVEQTPGPGDEVGLGDIELPAPTVLTGIVVGPDGQPLAGVDVRAMDVPPMVLAMFNVQHFEPDATRLILREGARPRVVAVPGWLRSLMARFAFRTAKTGADGRFELHGVMPGGNAVIARAPGLTTEMRASARARAGERNDVGTLRLRDGESAEIRVVDADGLAIAGAEVLVGPAGGSLPLDFVLPARPTDARGIATRDGLPTGLLSVAARRSPAHAWTVADVASVADDIEVVLPVTRQLTLRVCASSGDPIDGAAVRIAPEGAGVPFLAADWLDRGPMTSDAHGQLVVADLDTGRYSLEVSAAGYATRRVAVDVAGNVSEVVALEGAVTAEVLVVDSTGAPVSHAEVFVAPERDDANPRRLGSTDANGTCAIASASPGEVIVTARHPAFGVAVVRATWPETVTRVVLPDVGTIEGFVDPVPTVDAPRVRISIRPVDDESGHESFRTVVADADGSFRIRGLTPGEYRVRTMPSLDHVRSIGSALQNFMIASAIQNDPVCEVRAGAVTRVVVRGDTDAAPPTSSRKVALRGSVLVDGLPAAGSRVVAIHAGGIDTGDVAGDGTFEVPDLVGDRVKVAISRPARPDRPQAVLWRAEVRLHGVDRDLHVRVRTGSLAGRVVDADGDPVSQASVLARGSLGGESPSNSSADTVTDAAGRFLLNALPAGEYELQVFGTNGARATAGDFEVAPGGRVDGVEVQMK